VDVVTDEEHSPDDVPCRELSRRQREVAALIAAGYTNQEIARELSLAMGTVNSHIQQVRWRLGVEHRTQIAIWAARQGLHPRTEEPDRS
jgi:DNA-binding NarL/FixJ family response regulator